MIDVKCMSSCALALDVARASYVIDYTLHVNAGWNHDTVADYDGKGGSQIYAVPGFGAFGVDGAAQLEKHLGAGGDGVVWLGERGRGRMPWRRRWNPVQEVRRLAAGA